MKGVIKPSIVKMEPEVFESLVKEVKETIARNIKLPENSKRFGIADLWNIRRNVKTARNRFRG